MKVIVLYRPDSERSRLTEEFMAEFQHRNPLEKLETVNIDSRDGIAMMTMYDIVDFPTVLVMRDDGSIQKSWSGETLPLIDEVAGYLRA